MQSSMLGFVERRGVGSDMAQPEVMKMMRGKKTRKMRRRTGIRGKRERPDEKEREKGERIVSYRHDTSDALTSLHDCTGADEMDGCATEQFRGLLNAGIVFVAPGFAANDTMQRIQGVSDDIQQQFNS